MKAFFRSFILTFVIGTVALSGVFIGIAKLSETLSGGTAKNPDGTSVAEGDSSKNIKLDQYIKDKKRLNILVLGTDGARSDTMMMVSMGLHNQTVKVLSIPRDTYHPLKNIKPTDPKKINGIYGYNDERGGSEGVRKEIEKFLNVEIPFVIEADYNAVKEIVDVLGGVEYDVPFNMNYDDNYSEPPLHIHLKKGPQVLDGEKALQFLRWRKNNGEEGLGDMERIKRQQAFITASAKKAVSLKLPMVIKTAFENVKTNMTVQEMLYTGTQMMGTDFNAIEKTTLPGSVGMKKGVSFFFADEEAIKETLKLMMTDPPVPQTSQ